MIQQMRGAEPPKYDSLGHQIMYVPHIGYVITMWLWMKSVSLYIRTCVASCRLDRNYTKTIKIRLEIWIPTSPRLRKHIKRTASRIESVTASSREVNCYSQSEFCDFYFLVSS